MVPEKLCFIKKEEERKKERKKEKKKERKKERKEGRKEGRKKETGMSYLWYCISEICLQ